MSVSKKRSPIWQYFDSKSDDLLCQVEISRGGEGKKAVGGKWHTNMRDLLLSGKNLYRRAGLKAPRAVHLRPFEELHVPFASSFYWPLGGANKPFSLNVEHNSRRNVICGTSAFSMAPFEHFNSKVCKQRARNAMVVWRQRRLRVRWLLMSLCCIGK
ncbi:hypothetical protein WA026_021853 [Henosepilachna vigintioctopunctata]|uniref:Uncharacterized protein n=1 Tax=Henosepilachna vigintioctopunctata TaxID=420089 RepID=A0AAW1UFX1_9CUCU